MKKHFTLVVIFSIACYTGFAQSVTITPDSPRMLVKGPSSQQGLDLSTNDQYLNARVLQNTNSTFDKDMFLGYESGNTSALHLFSNNLETLTIKDGRVGVRMSTPRAPLQFESTFANRKIVLYDDADNDHQFNGFGIGNAVLRYQVATTGGNHVFYAGANSSTSNELMRIKGNGNVGIGTSSPNAPLQFGNVIANRKIVLWEDYNNDHQFNGLGINDAVLRYQVAHTNANHVFYAAANGSASNELMRITGNGNVGIQNSNPSAPLHFANVLRQKKIVLYEDANNDHEFVGLGVTSGEYRYQTNRPGSAHVFYAGINSTSSLELMRIHGDGKVSIGTSVNTTDELKVYAASEATIKTESANGSFAGLRSKNSLREYFVGIPGYHDRWGVYDNIAGAERLTLLPNGNMGIGTVTPDNKLDVLGTIRANEVIIESGWADYVFDEGFKLKSLTEVENYIKENKHLPDVPSAKEVQEKGAHVSDLMTKMMQKIEELTLYSIAQQKKIEALEKRLNEK